MSGALRIGVLAACSPVLQDAVITGEGQECVGLLVWLNAAGCQSADRRGRGACRSPSLAATSRRARSHRAAIAALERRERPGIRPGSRGCCCCKDAPSIDANEITDKGYINQRRALERRTDRRRAAVRGSAGRRGHHRRLARDMKAKGARPHQLAAVPEIPASLMTGPHLSISAFRNAPSSAGVEPIAATPS